MEMTGENAFRQKTGYRTDPSCGIGMVDGMLSLIPAAKVGHIGLYRDEETHEPHEYYCKLPADCSEREVFVVDPMLCYGEDPVSQRSRC